MRDDTRSMRKYLVAGLIVTLFFSSALSVSAGSRHPANAPAIDGDIPTWSQGDVWTYTVDPLQFSTTNESFTGAVHDFQETVLGITDDAYQVSISGEITGTLVMSGITGTVTGDITGTMQMRVSDLSQESMTLHSQGTILVYAIPLPYQMDLTMTSEPSLEAFDFPIIVGEQWQLQCLSTTTGSFTIQGIVTQPLNGSQWIDETVQCTTTEPLTVPAGSFDCYKIARTDTTVWYSSDTGNIVKSTVDQSSGDMTMHMTLTLQSYSHSLQPLTVTEEIDPSITIPGNLVSVSGQVKNTQTGAPIPQAVVVVEIPSASQTLTAMTNTTGQYIAWITAPTMIDDTPSGRETGSGGVIAQCTSGDLSGYHVQTLVTVLDTAPTTPVITGQVKGKPNTPYTYTFVSADADDDLLYYLIMWGDNSTSGWIGPYDAQTNVTVSHTYAMKGTYFIQAQARDVYGAESDWGTLSVQMPLYAAFHFSLFQMLEQFCAAHPHLFPLLRLLVSYVTD